MKWFKHNSNFHTTEFAAETLDVLGAEAYGVWFIIQEIIARNTDETGAKSVRFSLKTWAKTARVSTKKFQKFVDFWAKLGEIFVEIDGDFCTLSNDNILKLQDEWTRKKSKNSGETPELARARLDKERDKEESTYVLSNPPTPLCKGGDCRGDETTRQPSRPEVQSTPREEGTNPRALGTAPRKTGTNPRAAPDTVAALKAAIDEFTPNEDLRLELHEFRRMRERIRKPLTGRALKLAFGELEKLAPGNTPEQVKIVQQSILHSWQGFFSLRDNTAPLPRGQPGTRPVATTQWQKDRQAMEDMAEFALKAWEEIENGELENHSNGIVKNGCALPPANEWTGT